MLFSISLFLHTGTMNRQRRASVLVASLRRTPPITRGAWDGPITELGDVIAITSYAIGSARRSVVAKNDLKNRII